MTTRKEETVYKNKDVTLGVEVDIFPLDAWDDDLEKAKKEANRIAKSMLWLGITKLDEPLTDNPIKRFLWRFVMLFLKKVLGGKYFVKKIIKESNK